MSSRCYGMKHSPGGHDMCWLVIFFEHLYAVKANNVPLEQLPRKRERMYGWIPSFQQLELSKNVGSWCYESECEPRRDLDEMCRVPFHRHANDSITQNPTQDGKPRRV